MQTSRRAARTARLKTRRQQICGLAREFGDDPTSAGWKLGKAKATPLIGAILDRVNAQAPAD